MHTLTCTGLALLPDRARARVAGLVITRQRPGTASGVVFVTLEDETGTANVIIWPKIGERFRRAVLSGRLLRVTGQLQREGAVTHLVARRIEDLSHLLERLARPEAPEHPDAAPAASPAAPPWRPAAPGHPRDQAGRVFRSRNFH